jgi:hypothetical protein
MERRKIIGLIGGAAIWPLAAQQPQKLPATRYHKESCSWRPNPLSYVLRIPDAAITDLKSRLSGTRFPDSAPGEPWAYGSSVDYIRDLVAYWKDDFDWRAQEAALNEFSQFKVPLHEIN